MNIMAATNLILAFVLTLGGVVLIRFAILILKADPKDPYYKRRSGHQLAMALNRGYRDTFGKSK